VTPQPARTVLGEDRIIGERDRVPVIITHELTQIWYGTQDMLSPSGHSEWLARTVPGAIVRRTGLGHFGDPDADTVERLTRLTAAG